MGLQPLNADIEVHGRSPFANATHFARVARAVDSLLVNVTPDLWSASTPCTDWDLAQLTEHLIDVNHSFAAQLAGTTLAKLTPADSAVARYRTSSKALQRALIATQNTSDGFSTPLRSRLALRVADLLVHGWDIATATGQPARMPDDVTAEALAFLRRRAGVLRRSGQFGEPQPVDAHAPALDELAALSGRTLLPR
jgi:uncharacterized protein (TIGR03086 family)